MNNRLAVFHIDLDGLGCVALAKFFSSQLGISDIWIRNYTDYEDGTFEYNRVKEYQEIWFFDFTPDEKCRQVIQENSMTCIIGDHHAKVKEEIDKWDYNKTYIYREDISGTEIFFNFLVDTFHIEDTDVIKEFVQLVTTYDLYKEESPLWKSAQDLNRLLFKVCDYSRKDLDKYKLFFDIIDHKFSIQDHFEFNKIEKIKIQEAVKKEEELFNKIISNPGKYIKTRKDSIGRYFCIIQLNSKISITCNKLLAKYSKVDYIMAINTYNPDNPSISLRSRKGINLLEYEGVSGHEEAAGMPNMTEEYIDKLWSGKIHGLKVIEGSNE